MSMRAFQLALCELVASPDLCLDVRAGRQQLCARFGLSDLEARRLETVVGQLGMSTNCTLHRSNRIAPIYTLLHNTCFLLGETLGRVVDAYWRDAELFDLQFSHEIERFAHFLKGRLRAGDVDDPYVEEVLDFELAVNELRFAPRREILRKLQGADPGRAGPPRLHPLVRVVLFSHEPTALLGMLAEQRYPSPPIPSGAYFVVLSMVDVPLSATTVPEDVGRALWRLQANAGVRLAAR